MWVDHNGMTLYTFDKDAGGKSMCNGDCATNWPPLKVTAGEKLVQTVRGTGYRFSTKS